MWIKLGNARLLSKVVDVPINTSSSKQGLSLPFVPFHLLLIFSEFLNFDSLVSVQWYLTLICISFTANVCEYEYLFIGYGHICVSSSLKYTHSFFCLHFNKFLLNWFWGLLYVFCLFTFYSYLDYKWLFGLPFHFIESVFWILI